MSGNYTPTTSQRGRTTRRFKALAHALRERHLPCWLCGQPINYEADAQDDDAFSVDHVRPVSLDPSGAEDPNNLRPAHQRCNKRRGNRAPTPTIGHNSEQW